jgi:hypothetical protein
MAITGECLCGKVVYQVNGRLQDARCCHCSRCRKAFSAQASADAQVAPGTFQWLSGQDLLTTCANKDGFALQFCSCCGSTLCASYLGDVHGVTLGCVNPDPGIEIGMHIFVESMAAWETIPDGVTQFAEGPAFS